VVPGSVFEPTHKPADGAREKIAKYLRLEIFNRLSFLWLNSNSNSRFAIRISVGTHRFYMMTQTTLSDEEMVHATVFDIPGMLGAAKAHRQECLRHWQW
jgi:hypothetical protein